MSKLDPRVAEEALTEARAHGIDARMDYEKFLQETGRDDSFVGSPEDGIPGTHDVYVASQELVEAEPTSTPSP